ncbi:hypothetical protein GJ496_000347 [Pomphorhynchus laevis]|nr:hypothetical protein GJ496_000347 [Pomphorhynchus laevis]
MSTEVRTVQDRLIEISGPHKRNNEITDLLNKDTLTDMSTVYQVLQNRDKRGLKKFKKSIKKRLRKLEESTKKRAKEVEQYGKKEIAPAIVATLSGK